MRNEKGKEKEKTDVTLSSPFDSFYPLQVVVPSPSSITSPIGGNQSNDSNWDHYPPLPHQDFNDPVYSVWRESMIIYLSSLPDLNKQPPELKNILLQLATSIVDGHSSHK